METDVQDAVNSLRNLKEEMSRMQKKVIKAENMVNELQSGLNLLRSAASASIDPPTTTYSHGAQRHW